MKSKHKKADKKIEKPIKQDKSALDFTDEMKRLNRITGQIEGIQKMLGAGRKLDDVLTQCKAVHSALTAIENRVFKIYLDATLDDLSKMDKKKNREVLTEELESMFKKVA